MTTQDNQIKQQLEAGAVETINKGESPYMTSLLFQFTTEEGGLYGDAFLELRDYARANNCKWDKLGLGSHRLGATGYIATGFFEMRFPNGNLYLQTRLKYEDSPHLMKATG